MTENILRSAEIALASYSNLTDGSLIPQESELRQNGNGLSQVQASHFSSQYTIITQYNDATDPDGSGTSFSATVFKDVTGNLTLAIRGTLESTGLPNDFSTDIDIYTDGAGYDQIVAMYNWWLRASTPATETVLQYQIVPGPLDPHEGFQFGTHWLKVLPPVAGSDELVDLIDADADHSLEVTGHSLGGHLAMAFGALFPQVTKQVTAFNAPGFLDTAKNQSFFAALGGGVPSGISTTNVIADEAGVGDVSWSAIAGLHSRPGVAIDIPVENQWSSDEPDPPAGRNHSQQTLTDALAVYATLSRLDPTLDAAEFKSILNSAAVGTAGSLEGVVDVLTAVFNHTAVPLATGNANRDALYQALYALPTSTPEYGIVALSTLSPDAVAIAAQSDKGFLYALEHLSPFAVVGDDSLYPELAANDYTAEYLLDRATLLEDKLIRAVNDYPPSGVGPEFSGQGPYAGQFLHLVDDTTNYEARKYNGVPEDAELMLRFGRDEQGDTLAGGAGKDHLYGRGGDDTLEGSAGDDYLEGGAGSDTYIFNPGDGADTILDSDGVGSITIHSTTGTTVLGGTMDSVPGAANLYEDSAGNRYAKVGNNLKIGLKNGGGQITVKNFTEDALGIRLNTVQPPSSQQSPAGIKTFTLGQIGQYAEVFSPTVYAPTVHPIYGLIDNPLLTEVIQAVGSVAPLAGSENGNQFVSGEVYGGLGDSYIQGDAGFNYLVDDLYYTQGSTDGKPVQWLTALPDTGPLLEGGIYVSLGDSVGNDVLKGGAGDDWLESHGGDDWLYGEQGNDTLIDNPGLDFGDNRWLALPGAGSDDHLFGGPGDDTIFSLQGADYLDGGEDNDILLSGQSDDILSGGNGNDWLLADAALIREEFVVQPDGSYNHILEAVDATKDFGKDTLFGDAGDDILAGGGDNDWLLGGTENDTLWGDGTSTYNDEIGELRVTVGNGVLAGNDSLFGEEGNDTLVGGGGDDYLDGGDGDDTLTGDHVDLDSAYQGNDHLAGGQGNDTLFGNDGDDTLSGDSGDDTLWGDQGSDYLYGGDGADRLYGGSGDDALSGDEGDDQLLGGDGADSLSGNAGADRFDGGGGDDLLSGGSGNDELYGSAGNDMLQGGAGTDLLFGGDGDDVYRVNAGGGQDVIIDTQGINSIAFGAGITLERLGFQEIQATDGAHYLVMDTGAPGARVFLRNAPQGTISSVSFANGTVLSLADLLAYAAIPLTVLGGNEDDTIQGGAVADVFQGGGGNDRMFGADGADTLSGGDGQDLLNGDSGDDTLNGGAGNDELRGGAGSDSYLLSWGMGQDTLVEATGENSLLQLDTGVSLSDIVFVRSGNDLLVQLQGASDSLRIRDYVSGGQVLTLRTAAGVSTVVNDALIDSAPLPVASDAAAVHARYLTTVRAIFNSTRGDDGSILGTGGVLRRITSQATTYGAQTDYFNERLEVVDQYSDANTISRESSPDYQSTRVQTGQNGITHADVNAEVTQQPFDTTGGIFQQSAGTGVEPGPGAVLVTVHGHPETFNGDYADQVTGYWLFPSGLDATQAPDLQFNTIQNRTYQTDATLTVERITAGASDNDISTSGYSIVDAGAGNDTVTAYFSWDWHYNYEFHASASFYDRPYDKRNVGAMLDGNTGNDRLIGGEADDTLIGGDGNDFMNGGAGSDTYVVTAGATGWDIIEDSGGQAWDWETFTTRYQDWYYQSLNIDRWRYRRDQGETLPELPAIAINDFARISQLATAGIITTDSVEFGDGISASDLTVSWGEYIPYVSGEPNGTINQEGPNHWMDPGSVHTTLDISWGTGSGVRVVMPHSSPLDSPVPSEILSYAPYPDLSSRNDWYLGQGIEKFRFADGSELSMQAMLALAPPLSTLDPHRLDNQVEGTSAADVIVGAGGNDTLDGGAGYDTYVFNPGDGIDTITDAVLNGEANGIRFGPGIQPGDISVSWTADGITIHTGSSGDAIKLVNTVPNGDPSQIIDYLLFAFPGEGEPGALVRLPFTDFSPAGGGGIPGMEITGTSRHDTLTGTPGDDVIAALAGNDKVNAGDGDDLIIGGAGRDLLNGEGGNDTFVVTGTDRRFDRFNGGEGTDRVQGGDGDDTIRVRRFNADNSVEVIDGGAGVNVIAGTRGYDNIDLGATRVLNIDHIDAGSGNDRVTGTDNGDVLRGGPGFDRLNGGLGDDLYLFDRNDGRDRIIDVGAGPNNDRIRFGENIRHDQLWFRRLGNALNIELIGTRDEITVANWYAGDDNQIESLQSGDGYILLNTQVDQLVQAMAAFSPPASSQLDLTPQLQSQLEPTLAVNWQLG